MGISFDELLNPSNLLFSLVSTLFLLGSYPMTQIYQHEVDKAHGDQTLSRVLGIKGTFIFTAAAFLLASALIAILYFGKEAQMRFLIYMLSIMPILIYFFRWWTKASKDKGKVDYDHAMRLNMLSSVCLCVAFITMRFL